MKITFLTIILPVMAFSASTRPRTGSMNRIIRQTRESQRPMRPRFESANSKDEIMETKKETFECYHFGTDEDPYFAGGKILCDFECTYYGLQQAGSTLSASFSKALGRQVCGYDRCNYNPCNNVHIILSVVLWSFGVLFGFAIIFGS